MKTIELKLSNIFYYLTLYELKVNFEEKSNLTWLGWKLKIFRLSQKKKKKEKIRKLPRHFRLGSKVYDPHLQKKNENTDTL